MSTSLQTILTFALQPIFRIPIAPNGLPFKFGSPFTWESGLAANQADLGYPFIGSIASTGSPFSLDLNGSLTTVDGSPCNFAKITAICAIHLGIVGTDDANIISIGGGSNAVSTFMGGTSPVIKLYAGGQFLLTNPTLAGYAITPSTADMLQFATAAGINVPFVGCLIGRSA